MQHTLKAFDADIDGMRSTVMAMGGLVEKQVARAVEAIEHSDLRLVSQVLIDEEVVNNYHIQTDIICNRILAKRQPLAIDLREVIGTLHTVNDLERIGDEAKKIAKRVRDLEQHSKRGMIPFVKISQMAEAVREMLQQALDAFLRHDPQVATRLVAQDIEVDQLRDTLNADLAALMSSEPSCVSGTLNLVFIVQSIERIGDHAKNIAEYVVNVVEGVDMRHAGGDFSKASRAT
jgi:phosphate transport system protein